MRLVRDGDDGCCCETRSNVGNAPRVSRAPCSLGQVRTRDHVTL